MKLHLPCKLLSALLACFCVAATTAWGDITVTPSNDGTTVSTVTGDNGTITATVNYTGDEASNGTVTISSTGGSLVVAADGASAETPKTVTLTTSKGYLSLANNSTTSISAADGTTLVSSNLSAINGATENTTSPAHLIVGSNATLSFSDGINLSAGSVAVENGGTIHSNVLYLSSASQSSTVSVNGGSLDVTGSTTFRDRPTTLTISNGGTVYLGDGVNIQSDAAGSTINMSGNGSLLVLNNGLGHGGGGAGTSAFEFNGGTLGATTNVGVDTSITVGGTATIKTNKYSRAEDGTLSVGTSAVLFNLTKAASVAAGAELIVDGTGAANFKNATTTNSGKISVKGGATAYFKHLQLSANDASLEMSDGRLVLGSGGITAAESATLKSGAVTLSVGTLEAAEDWSAEVGMTLGNLTINTTQRQQSGDGYLEWKDGERQMTITLNGELTFTGSVTQVGTGKVVIGSEHFDTGDYTWTVNSGTLELGSAMTTLGGTVALGDDGFLALGDTFAYDVDMTAGVYDEGTNTYTFDTGLTVTGATAENFSVAHGNWNIVNSKLVMYAHNLSYTAESGALTWSETTGNTFGTGTFTSGDAVTFTGDVEATLDSDVYALKVTVGENNSLQLTSGGHSLSAGVLELGGTVVIDSATALGSLGDVHGSGSVVLKATEVDEQGYHSIDSLADGYNLVLDSAEDTSVRYKLSAANKSWNSITVKKGSQLALNADYEGNVTISGTGTDSTDVDKNGALKLMGGKTLTGNVTVASEGAAINMWGGDTGTIDGNIVMNGDLSKVSPGTLIVTGNISGAGHTLKIDGGTLHLLKTGGLNVDTVDLNGTLKIEGTMANAQVSNWTFRENATIDIYWGATDRKSLNSGALPSSFAGNLKVSRGGLAIDKENTSFKSITVASGSQVRIEKNTTADVTISGDGMTNQHGALQLADGVEVTGKMTLAADARISLWDDAKATINGNLEMNGALKLNDGGGTSGSSLTITGAVTGENKEIYVGQGSLILNDITGHTGHLKVASNGSLSVGKATNMDVRQGTVTVTGTNTEAEGTGAIKLTGADTKVVFNTGGDYYIDSFVLSSDGGGDGQKHTLEVASGTTLHVLGTTNSTTDGSMKLSNWGGDNHVVIKGTLEANAYLSNKDGSGNVDVESGGELVMKTGLGITAVDDDWGYVTLNVKEGGTLTMGNTEAFTSDHLTVSLANNSTLAAHGSATVGYAFDLEGKSVNMAADTQQTLTYTADASAAAGITATGGGTVALTNAVIGANSGIAPSAEGDDVGTGTAYTVTAGTTLTIGEAGKELSFTQAGEANATISASGVAENTTVTASATSELASGNNLTLGSGSTLVLASGADGNVIPLTLQSGASITFNGGTIDLTGLTVTENTTLITAAEGAVTGLDSVTIKGADNVSLTVDDNGNLVVSQDTTPPVVGEAVLTGNIVQTVDYNSETKLLTFKTDIAADALLGETLDLSFGSALSLLGTIPSEDYWSQNGVSITLQAADGTTLNLDNVTTLSINGYDGFDPNNGGFASDAVTSAVKDGNVFGNYYAPSIPEPATATLSLLALAALAARRRRK